MKESSPVFVRIPAYDLIGRRRSKRTLPEDSYSFHIFHKMSPTSVKSGAKIIQIATKYIPLGPIKAESLFFGSPNIVRISAMNRVAPKLIKNTVINAVLRPRHMVNAYIYLNMKNASYRKCEQQQRVQGK